MVGCPSYTLHRMAERCTMAPPPPSVYEVLLRRMRFPTVLTTHLLAVANLQRVVCNVFKRPAHLPCKHHQRMIHVLRNHHESPSLRPRRQPATVPISINILKRLGVYNNSNNTIRGEPSNNTSIPLLFNTTNPFLYCSMPLIHSSTVQYH